MRTSLLPLIAAAGLTLSSAGLAQPPEIRRGTLTTLAEVSLEFPGGSMEQFVTALRSAANGPVNIVLQGRANQIHVDAMKLKDVTVQSAVRAAIEPRIGVTEMNRDGTSNTITFTTVQPESQGQPVFIIGLRDESAAPGRGGGLVTEVVSIQRLLPGGDASARAEQVILSAIDSGLKLTHAEEEARPDISYHRDSGLLLVRGNVYDVRVVKDIIGRMLDDHDRRTVEAAKKKKAAISRDSEMQKLKVRLELAERRADVAGQRMGEMDKLVQSGNAPPSELSNAMMAREEAMAQCKLIQIEMAEIAQQAELGDAEPEAPKEPPPEPAPERPKAPAGGKAKTKGQ